MSKRKNKTPTEYNYTHKNIYFDESDQFQNECLKLLSICERKQAKLLSLIIHDFITRYGIDLDNLTKETLMDFMKILEIQLKSSFNLMSQIGYSPYNMAHPSKTIAAEPTPVGQQSMYQQIPAQQTMYQQIPNQPVGQQTMNQQIPAQHLTPTEDEDMLISEEDKAAMNNALDLFGTFNS